MIKKEFFRVREDGVKLYKIYSDENYKITQLETGVIYDDVIDTETANYSYEETTEKIEEQENT